MRWRNASNLQDQQTNGRFFGLDKLTSPTKLTIATRLGFHPENNLMISARMSAIRGKIFHITFKAV